MRVYEKPSLNLEMLEVSDIITVSSAFDGLANPESVIKEDLTTLKKEENW